MTDGEDPGLDVSPPEAPGPEEAVEAYESDGMTVLYESTNPLAWIESSEAYPIEEFA